MSLPIQAAMISKHQQPNPERSLGSIKFRYRAVDIEKYLLNRVLRFMLVLEDLAGDAENQIAVSLVQDRQCVVATRRQRCSEVFIAGQPKPGPAHQSNTGLRWCAS